MNLLREIQDAATSSEVPLADILRKCKVLAARLHSAELAEWVDHELNGYKGMDNVPDYRILRPVESRGTFVGPFGSSAKDIPIPYHSIRHVLPNNAQEILETFRCNDGVSAIADLVKTGEQYGKFWSHWPANLVSLVGTHIYHDMNCIDAWQAIPRSFMVGILDTVRNKILNFAIDIERENPDAGEADVRTIPVPQPVVQNVFNQHFHGSVGNVAAGSHDFEQHATVNQLEVPNSIDLPSLAQELMRLRQQQVTEATEPEHYEAIGAVQRAEIAANDGDRGKVSTSLAKAGHWTLDVATKIGTTLAAEALKHSMGLK